METNYNIQKKIDDTFAAMDAIENVNVSPFFKDKTMQRMFAEKEEKQIVWSWFTPKLQLATLVCIIALNVMAFTNLNTSAYQDNISEFAETYGLSSSSNDTFINLK